MKILQLSLYIWIVGTNNEIFAQLSGRIVAGDNCDSADYPYLAAIASGSQPYCEGSFVTPEWVLTAAHCCIGMRDLRRFTVLAGQSRWLQDVEATSPIAGIFSHRAYVNYPLTSDLCLVKLQRPVTPSSKVKISKLATTADYEGFIKAGKCNNTLVMKISGHDERLHTAKRQASPREKISFDPRVKCTNLQVLPRSKCNDYFGYHHMVTNDVFCMDHDPKSGIVTCKGDSGGPVYCENLQIGIVSGGLVCGDWRFTGFYIRVDQFRDFIERQIQMQERKLIDSISVVDITNSTGNATNTGTSAPMDTTTKGKSSAIRYKGSFQIFMIFVVIINIVAMF